MRGLRSVSVAFVAMVGLVASGSAYASSPPSPSWTPAAGSSADFGTVQIGQTQQETFTLRNSGGTATSMLNVSLSGSSTFAITSNGCSATSLGPKKRCSVTVNPKPGLGQRPLA